MAAENETMREVRPKSATVNAVLGPNSLAPRTRLRPDVGWTFDGLACAQRRD